VYGYALGIVGNQVTFTCDNTVGHCFTFTYDDFGRLSGQTSYTNGPQNLAWTYDLYSNRLTQSVTGGSGSSFTGTYNPATNQLPPPYQYDAAGNMLNDTYHSYTYDSEGNVLTVDGGDNGQYIYDAFNNRVHFATYNAGGSTTYEYAYDYAGRRVST
jgi:YD repeat-containing protein